MKGEVISVEPKEAVLRLAEDVEGVIKAAEISMDRVEDVRNALKVGDEMEAKIVSVDRKNRFIGLSIKAKLQDEERSNLRDHKSREAEQQRGPTTLGELIKQQMDKGGDQQGEADG